MTGVVVSLGNCFQSPSILSPFSLKVPNGLNVGRKISIRGFVIDSDESFKIVLSSGPLAEAKEIGLELQFNLFHNSARISSRDGIGHRLVFQLQQPIRRNGEFQIDIECEIAKFDVYVNGGIFQPHQLRVEYKKIDHISVEGEFLASRKRYKEAAVHYEKAAQLRPMDFELAVAAATAMRQAERFEEAEIWYRRAVEVKPMDARSYTNLGAILHLNGKYAEAASSYRHALKLQPNDATTITNLHKLHAITTT